MINIFAKNVYIDNDFSDRVSMQWISWVVDVVIINI